MRWTPGDRGNIEDRRGQSSYGSGGFGGGFNVGRLGIGGVVLLLGLSWLTGTNLFTLLDSGAVPDGTSAPASAPARSTPEEERMVDFVDTVTNDAQEAWLRMLGNRYQRTTVVLFRDATQSGCGFAQSATGPFYCPGDRKVYLDLGFFEELDRKFGAPGDFAQAYVIAHELGHHVQNLLGLNERAAADRRSGADSASVALELQADCFAGVWGQTASRGGQLTAGHVQLDPGDDEEALRAAAAIGDDRLQHMAGGRVMPEKFTHGTSAQRVDAFRRGMSSGDPNVCLEPGSRGR